MLLLPSAALGEESPRRLAHYTHQQWTEQNEAPAPVADMAQGHDGFLWLAAGEGLFRFDGVNFEEIKPEEGDEKDNQPSALLVTRDGDVWTNFRESRRFAIYRDGALRLVNAPPAPDWIIALAEGPDGAIWALTAKFDAEVLRLQDGRWRLFDATAGLPLDDALSMLVAADGALWVSFSNSVARLPSGAERFETVRQTPKANGRLSQDPAGRVWLSEKGGSYPLTGAGGRGSPPALHSVYATDDAQIRGAPMFDRAGNLWIATRYNGVQRVALPDPSGRLLQPGAGSSVETFVIGDGLSSNVTNKVLEDREGNVWIGTEKGLDKLRPATLRFEPALTAPAAFGDKLMEASDGSVYIGQSKTIYRAAPGGDPTAIMSDVSEPESICEAPDGAIWIAFATRIIVWESGQVREMIDRPHSDSTHNIIWDCAFDAHGDYWISAGGGGLHRYRGGQWEAMFGPTDEKDFYPMTLVADPHGRLIVQWEQRRLAWIDYPEREFAPLDFGTADPREVTLYTPSTGEVFAAGEFGLTRFHAGSVQTIWANETRNGRISGIVQTPEGDIWLAYPKELVRIRSQDLERAFTDLTFFAPSLSLGVDDGLTSRPHSHTQRSMVRGRDGRIWVATETGTLWMDPQRTVRNALPPDLAIKSVTGDGRLYRDPASLKLPAATSNIEIDYAVLSFANPKQVTVRYMLEGFDNTWVDPGTRRQAFYTNLPPGKYRFRMIAANNDGVWNRDGAAVDFEIPPTFVQSRWFLAICLGVSLLVFWILYKLRLAHVAGQIRIRLEERLGERERIARELHDTLLQSVQGLILRFQSVANRMPPEEPNRQLLESALKRADDVIIDGRNRVRDLRVDDKNPSDPRAIIKELANRAGFDPPIPIRVVIEGKQRRLDPLVSAEIKRIAGEALFNIARHARANCVETTVTYGEQRFRLQIRDDGVGIANSVLKAGHKEGHFGLLGMRERAEHIGGAIFIHSRPGNGTEVMLSFPAKIAYEQKAVDQRFRFGWSGLRKDAER